MNLICVVWLSGALLLLILSGSGVCAELLTDLTSERGLDMGEGLTLHLEDLERDRGGSLLEKYGLRVDFRRYGLKFWKAEKRDAVEIGLILDNSVGEGRGSKNNGYPAIMMLVGYKLATVVTTIFAIVSTIVFKAISVSKIAFVLGVILLTAKLFQHGATFKHPGPVYYELDPSETEPMIAYSSPDLTNLDVAYHPSGTAAAANGNYYAYNNLIADDLTVDGTANSYSTVETSLGNSSANASQQSVARRREYTRRKNKVPLLSIHRYS